MSINTWRDMDAEAWRTAPRYDSHEAHELEQLRYQLGQERKLVSHFKSLAHNRLRDLESVRETAKRNLDALDKALEATGGVVPEFQRQDQFTICILADPVSERLYTGAACCGPQDEFNFEIGKALSLGRAMKQRADDWAKRAFDR